MVSNFQIQYHHMQVFEMIRPMLWAPVSKNDEFCI